MRGLPEGVSRADVALAAGLTAAVCTEAGSPAYAGPVWVAVAAAATSSLAVRRRWPAEVALVLSAVQVPLALTAAAPFPPQLPLLPVLLSLYAAALALTGRRAVVTAGLTLLLAVAAHLASADGDLDDFWPYLLWAGPVAAGRLVRSRTLEAAAAARTAEALVARQEAETREAVERERDGIARELHDVVAHAVSVMVVQAGAERLALGADPAAARTVAALEAVEQAGREALGELRTMLAVLRATDVEAGGRRPRPDLAALDHLVERVRTTGCAVTARTVGDVAAVPAGVSVSAYRVVQEALTNAVRHAPGQPVRLHVAAGQDAVVVRVRNRLGPVPSQAGSGRGLLGVRERAALHGGDVTAGPVDGEWLLEARLPVRALVGR